MDMTFSDSADEFRQHVRDWFASEFPRDVIEKYKRGEALTTADVRRSESALGKKGWLASAWPKDHGGPGWTIEQQYIFDEELERAGVPTVTPMGVVYVGPVLYTFASDEQKARWLPGIRDGSTGWAQGYSEPGSGSDLASLQFSAVLENGVYRLNGHKIWTSAAQHADWIFLLARTSTEDKPQKGISFICCPLNAPGVTVKPIITIDGAHALNEVIFDDVIVPEDHRIGEAGKGWTYSQYLLGFERTSYARIGGKREMLRRVRALVPDADADFRRKIAEADMAVDGLEMTVMRILAAVNAGETPGLGASSVKILATVTHQQITELLLEAQAFNANAGSRETAMYFGGRAQSIYGGTNEIQRNIIARRVLGL